jgi:hypothetical protein
VLIFRIDESLYFGNIGQLRDLISKTGKLVVAVVIVLHVSLLHTLAGAHAHTHTHTHTHTIAHAHTHNRSRTHTHTLSLSLSLHPPSIPRSFGEEQYSSLCTNLNERDTGDAQAVHAVIFDMRNINSMDANAVMVRRHCVRRPGVRVCEVSRTQDFAQ